MIMEKEIERLSLLEQAAGLNGGKRSCCTGFGTDGDKVSAELKTKGGR